MTAVEPAAGHSDPFARLCTATGRLLFLCANRRVHRVCNRFVEAPHDGSLAASRCSYCALNHTIPDLSVAGHLQRWSALEAAKRRVLWSFDRGGVPYGGVGSGSDPPLSFRFMTDALPTGVPGQWVRGGGGEPVYTGHADGVITVNLKEADPVAREKLRVQMHEPKRTLVGHLRHEMGHYVWDLLVRNSDAERASFVAVFGDPTQPSYEAAMDRYYKEGPSPHWKTSHISGYATMHPWEDFAETFAWHALLMGTLETAAALGDTAVVRPDATLEARLDGYLRFSVELNEQARNFGLVDFVTESVPGPVQQKLAWVDGLILRHRTAPAAPVACAVA